MEKSRKSHYVQLYTRKKVITNISRLWNPTNIEHIVNKIAKYVNTGTMKIKGIDVT